MPLFAAARHKRRAKRFWLKPRAVAEIQFAEWTDENVLRQASYKGLRADKEARSVVRETARTLAQTDDGARKTSKSDKDSVLGVKISNPQRLVFASPILTKKRWRSTTPQRRKEC